MALGGIQNALMQAGYKVPKAEAQRLVEQMLAENTVRECDSGTPGIRAFTLRPIPSATWTIAPDSVPAMLGHLGTSSSGPCEEGSA